MARLLTGSTLVLLLVGLAATGCKHPASESEREDKAELVVLVRTAPVERQTVRELVETAGIVGPSLGAEAQVSAQVTGTVVNVLKDEGQEVVVSEPVLEIDAAVLREGVREAEAEVARAQADEALNRKKLARAKGLFAGEIAAAKEVAQAEADHADAAQALARAQATLRVARLQENRSVVRSPIAGTLLHRLVSPGQYVQPETVLFTVAPLDHLDLSCVVPASALDHLHIGAATEIDCPDRDDADSVGEVRLIAPALDPGSGTATVRVAIANEARALRPGMLCRARIVAARHDAVLVVPVSAVTFAEARGKGTVAVVDRDSVAHVREVTTGIREGDRVEIVQGLADGDRVVSEGSYGLADGTKVRLE
jgi:RND family efflux transporter MFP subunit